LRNKTEGDNLKGLGNSMRLHKYIPKDPTPCKLLQPRSVVQTSNHSWYFLLGIAQ
jgi:hypothetical protein